MKTNTTFQQDDGHGHGHGHGRHQGHDRHHGRPGYPADPPTDPPTDESSIPRGGRTRNFDIPDLDDADVDESYDAKAAHSSPNRFGTFDTAAGADADAGSRHAPSGSGRASSTRSPIADIAVELAALGQRWIGLVLEKGWIELRAHITEILTVIGLCLLGGILILGGIAYLDLLVYRWLVAALDSANWALFALALGHVAIGGVLIRVALQRMRGEDES